jgi:hypothetical protein
MDDRTFVQYIFRIVLVDQLYFHVSATCWSHLSSSQPPSYRFLSPNAQNQRYLSTHIHQTYLPLISMWNARTCLYSWPWREPKNPRQHIFLLRVFPSQEMQGSQSCPTAKQGWTPSTHGMEIWRCGRGCERSNSFFSCTATTARRWEIGAML